MGELARRDILQTPSSLTVCMSPVYKLGKNKSKEKKKKIGLQSKKAAAKLTQMSAFQAGFGRAFTVCGILCVSISLISTRMPSRVRKPTMIFGTPNRKDWIQYFMSLR